MYIMRRNHTQKAHLSIITEKISTLRSGGFGEMVVRDIYIHQKHKKNALLYIEREMTFSATHFK